MALKSTIISARTPAAIKDACYLTKSDKVTTDSSLVSDEAQKIYESMLLTYDKLVKDFSKLSELFNSALTQLKKTSPYYKSIKEW